MHLCVDLDAYRGCVVILFVTYGHAIWPGGHFPDSVVGEGEGVLMRVVRIAPFDAERLN